MSLVNTGMAVALIVSMTCGGALTDLFGVRQVIGGGAAMLILAGVLSLALISTTPAPRLKPGAEEEDTPAAMPGVAR